MNSDDDPVAKKQNEEGQGGAHPDRRVKPQCAIEQKLGRRTVARGIRDDEAGNNKENLNAHPTEPGERRGGLQLKIGGDVMFKTGRHAGRRPRP